MIMNSDWNKGGYDLFWALSVEVMIYFGHYQWNE
jgi:hypothetical protein